MFVAASGSTTGAACGTGDRAMNHEQSGLGTERRQYYASSRGPFQDSDNILAFYGGGGRGAVLDDIVRKRHALGRTMHVFGERGSGLTFLSLVLGDRLERPCNVIRHESPEGSVATLLRHLLVELCPTESGLIDAAAAAGDDVDERTLACARDRVLVQLAATPPGNKPYVLVVDLEVSPGASLLALLEALGEVRREGRLALQVVVFRTVDAAAMREAGRRDDDGRAGDGRYWLRRLTLAEVGEYLRHRMMLFDFSRRDLFTREMSYFVADRTEGVFGAVDTLVRHAFTLAGLEGAESPSMTHLLAAGLPPRPAVPVANRFLSRHRGAFVALLGLGVVGFSTALVLLAS